MFKSVELGTLKNTKSTRFDKEGLNDRGECKVIKSHKKLFIDELCYISTGVQYKKTFQERKDHLLALVKTQDVDQEI